MKFIKHKSDERQTVEMVKHDITDIMFQIPRAQRNTQINQYHLI